MAEYLCKCCGAPLEVRGQATVCRCTYCDVLQTIPRLDFDEKAILWERADKLRRAGEYDRAEELYRELLRLDDTDSEIYWCIVLCRYGIEYVEEYGSKKRVPTINRFSYRPIIDDDDYRAAVNIADGDRRRIYILQAAELEELRKRALAVSQTEQPYDIFICYKESDRDGRRTEDSVLAAELYRSLVADGYRVFFARVTLEDKIGREYEPYIFSAINSAKIMFAVGTSPENFCSPWVKNEWSRYLTRISESGEGVLAVLYKGMRREDLPKEFAHLQSFDMTAPDFTEELLRGVRKVFSANKPVETEQPEELTEKNAASLLRRAEILLDDGEFSRAEELCENALDLEPENARIYFVKLLSGFRVKTAKELGELTGDLEQSSNYRMIMRFGNDELKTELSGYRLAAAYRYYTKAGAVADTESEYQAAEKGLRSLDGYKDSTQRADKLHDDLIRLREKNAKFAEENIKRAENERKAAEEEQARLAKQKELSLKRRRIAFKAAIITLSAAAVVSCAGIGFHFITLSQKYNSAAAMLDSGEYDKAAEAFAALGDYSDSQTRVLEARYLKATELFKNGDHDSAETILKALNGYSDSQELLNKIQYDRAAAKLDNGEYDLASRLFYELRGYSDSEEKSKLALYKKAEELLSDGKTDDAENIFTQLGDYSDSMEKARGIRIEQVSRLIDEGYIQRAKALLKTIDGEELGQMFPDTKYLYAVILQAEKNYDDAIAVFKVLGDYKDSPERAKKARYERALAYIDAGEFDLAESELKALGDYADSAELAGNMNTMKFKNCKVGDVITFGNFPLSLMETGYTGDFDIEWKVIKRDGTRVLVISRRVLDVREFGGENWSESSLRSWLNNDFYNNCFSESEKAMIPTVTVTTPDNENTKLNGGPDTEDKIFLLSKPETYEYLFSAESGIKPSFTEWALEKYRLTKDEEYRERYGFNSTYWWTRTPGHLHDMSVMTMEFSFFEYAKPTDLYGVRPAMWIEMGE